MASPADFLDTLIELHETSQLQKLDNFLAQINQTRIGEDLEHGVFGWKVDSPDLIISSILSCSDLVQICLRLIFSQVKVCVQILEFLSDYFFSMGTQTICCSECGATFSTRCLV